MLKLTWISVYSTHTTLACVLTPPGHTHSARLSFILHSLQSAGSDSFKLAQAHENKTGHYGDQRNSAQE